MCCPCGGHQGRVVCAGVLALCSVLCAVDLPCDARLAVPGGWVARSVSVVSVLTVWVGGWAPVVQRSAECATVAMLCLDAAAAMGSASAACLCLVTSSGWVSHPSCIQSITS